MLMKALRIGLGQVIVAGDLLTRPPQRKRTAGPRPKWTAQPAG